MIKSKFVGTIVASILLTSSVYAADGVGVFKKKLARVEKRMKRSGCPERPRNKRACKRQVKRKEMLEGCIEDPSADKCQKILNRKKNKSTKFQPFKNRRLKHKKFNSIGRKEEPQQLINNPNDSKGGGSY